MLNACTLKKKHANFDSDYLQQMEFNVASLVEDVLQQHGKRLSEADNFASRRAQEAACMIHLDMIKCTYLSSFKYS